MPHDHPLTAVDSVTIPALASFPLISFSRDRPIGSLIKAAFRVAGHPRTIAVEVTQSACAAALVRSGAGVPLIDGINVATTAMAGWVLRPFVPRTAIIGQTLLPLDRPASRPIEAVNEVLHVTVSDSGRGRVGWTTDDS